MVGVGLRQDIELLRALERDDRAAGPEKLDGNLVAVVEPDLTVGALHLAVTGRRREERACEREKFQGVHICPALVGLIEVFWPAAVRVATHALRAWLR
ncbi:MAG: hypothetical protein M3Z29_05605 [Pseudomonadota bacterium]|nr:hypothetical protein [Pseudomonadota bacterium]